MRQHRSSQKNSQKNSRSHPTSSRSIPGESVSSPRTHHFRGWRIFRETRTRILLVYTLLMSIVTIASVPIFAALFFRTVDLRVQEDLEAGIQDFRTVYRAWQQNPSNDGTLENFAIEVLEKIQPEDDNYLIIYIDGKFYNSDPRDIPPQLGTGSAIEQYWLSLTHPSRGMTDLNPSIGSIFYMTEPLVLAGQQRGVFVAAHLAESERQEAFAGVSVFIAVTIGIVIISLILTWFAIGRLLTPVRRLALTARSIRESDLSHNLSRRLQVNGSGELAELVTTFNDMMDRLQTAFTSQRNFINDAGHELRTPITIIQGHLDLLQDLSSDDATAIAIVQDELERMNRLVNDMILLARAERPDFLQLETIDLSTFAEELFSKMQTLADRHWQFHLIGHGRMVGDRQRLTGAVINLAQNAVRHTQPTDSIELNVSINRQGVRLQVRDTGEGIDPKDQTRIFERFARAGDRQRQESSGLGLTIVKAIAESHGGSIELTSTPQVGSTFTLILPLEPPKERVQHENEY